MSDATDPALAFARALIDDARRDRQVLRDRWATRWRAEVQRIANTLEQNPALVPAVEAAIAEHVASEVSSDG